MPRARTTISFVTRFTGALPSLEVWKHLFREVERSPHGAISAQWSGRHHCRRTSQHNRNYCPTHLPDIDFICAFPEQFCPTESTSLANRFSLGGTGRAALPNEIQAKAALHAPLSTPRGYRDMASARQLRMPGVTNTHTPLRARESGGVSSKGLNVRRLQVAAAGRTPGRSALDRNCRLQSLTFFAP